MRLTKLISISLMPDFLREVEKVAKEENRTKSELIREALRRYIEDREWEKLTLYARKKSAITGIKTEEDIQRVVDDSAANNQMLKVVIDTNVFISAFLPSRVQASQCSFTGPQKNYPQFNLSANY